MKSIVASFVPIHSIPSEIIWSPVIQHLILYVTCIQSVPREVLSPNSYTSCLESLRAHFQDLEAGEALLPDVKVMVLGNGRIGKTQICNRLRGLPFEAESDSTHGITVTTTPLKWGGHSCPPCLPASVADGLAHPPSETSGQECPRSSQEAQAAKSRSECPPHLLRLWDFGGQDIYHGTHALFMRSRALFLLVWTPDSENSETHVHKGMTFRNQPLPYWLAYIRHLAGVQSPVLVIQNQCDAPADERLRPPVEDTLLQPFDLKKMLHYSAYNRRGHAALEEALQDAIEHLRQTQGHAVIGKGRLAVKQHIEALQKADAEIPEVALKKNRTIARMHFQQICDTCQGVSSPDHLLDYLHQTGIVFYQKGLFDDQIILDQAWALEAVYAVFNREKCYKTLKQIRGRFTRSLLESLVWQQHSEEEQKLFLTMMKSCGICFVHRRGDQQRGIETEYIAPDLLPEYAEVEDEVAAQWDSTAVCDEVQMEVGFLHAGLMRGLLSRIGSEAGMTAVYWKDGVCLYEKKTRSHARIEQRPVNRSDASPCSGIIHLRAYGGNSLQLLEMLTPWFWDEVKRAGCQTDGILTTEHPLNLLAKDKRLTLKGGSEVVDEEAEIDTPPVEMKPDFTSPPRTQTTYGVSYAWNDASQEIVNQLCDQAVAEHGVKILRDVTGMGLGESISKFMRTLTQQDRVFVILSAKYLQSPFCMYELWQIWINCRADDEAFRRCVRVYRLPDAAMMSPIERARCAKYWRDQFKELDDLVRVEGADLLGELDFKRYKLMQDFANRVGDILAVIADMLLPQDFSQLEQHGFGDAERESGE
ncbi:COR domain-containing protein [Prosthecobacter debontii]|uniref:COR domain-containing protein n=1 Tax=Prosthecobacter debontii TaxID=48467 RepID=UPI0015925A36|nr:COR domain-containing protein [Prosthecobacter debontii]